MKCKQLLALGCAVVMTVSCMTACQGNGSESAPSETIESTDGTEVAEATEVVGETVTARVTAVEGDKITAEVGTLSAQSMGEQPSGEAGEKPEQPSGEAGEKPEQPSGEAGEKPEQPSGEAPSGEAGEKPEQPSGEAPSGEAGEKPEQPSGEAPSGEAGEKPEQPSGEAPSGEAGEKPEQPSGEAPSGMPGGSSFVATGEMIEFVLTDATEVTLEFLQGSGEGSAEDIVLGAVLEIVLDEENNATAITVKNLNVGNGFGGSEEVTNGTSAETIEEDTEVEGGKYSSTGDDENALRVDGATVSLINIEIEKSGGESSNTENGDFYGQNAGFLALNGADVTLEAVTVNTDAVNGNGVFSYGEDTVVTISDSTIRTSQDNSGGIQTTGGGTMNASNLDVETQGNSAAAIRSDRGGGTVNVDGGTYVTNGTGSPAVYCTADIEVQNAILTANASEGVVVEGKNSVSLVDCDVTSDMKNTYNGDTTENIHGIMIYQSMSGDAAVGEAYFSAEGGSITTLAGDLFYVTNTDCEISLKDVVFTLANDVFLRVEGNSSSRGWGTEGANGGDVILTVEDQEMKGNILVDDISSLEFTMKNGTDYIGAINPNGSDGVVNVTLEAGATWTLTANSYVTSFNGNLSGIEAGEYHLYINGELAL